MLKRIGVLAIVAVSLVACQVANVSFPNAKLYPNDRRSETVPGLLAKPEGKGPFPAVVLLPTCGGMKSHVTSYWPDYLNGLGYVALTADSLGARGYATCTRSNFMGKNHHEISKDAYGALDDAGKAEIDAMLTACDMRDVLDMKLSRDIGTKNNREIWL